MTPPFITDNLSTLPSDYFQCFLADPPWRYKAWSPKGNVKHSAEVHYPTMTLKDLHAMGEQVRRISARHSWIGLWITGPFLAIGAHVKLLRTWGFEPSALGWVWVKLQNREEEALFVNGVDSFHFGQGKTTRHNTEVCILGRRGQPKRLSASVRELIIAPVREHSRKPREIHERMEEFCAGPRLEMFARRPPSTQNTHEWSLFGNQLDAARPARDLARTS